MKKYILGIVGLLFFLFLYYSAHPLATQIEINGHRFTVELAVTPKEQERGLGYRDSLPVDAGMLFVYQSAQIYGFWMKGMRFPIDIIWIADETIVDITKNAPVATTSSLPTYSPKEPANKVFEVHAGTADRLGFQIGDDVKILKR